jgi:hypothetical protein
VSAPTKPDAPPSVPLYTAMSGTNRLRCSACANTVLDHRHARQVHADKHLRDGRARWNAEAKPPRWDVVNQQEGA